MTDRDLFIAALDRTDPAERAAWLDLACAGDADCRRRVDVLLRAHENASRFLANPAGPPADSAAPDDPTRTAHPSDETSPATTVDVLTLLAPADKPGLLGRLDHFEVLELVGKGGMGVVLKAFDPKLHRLVALKLMAPHLAAHGSARKRFEREARAVAAVKNEHVVAIHGVETDGPTLYLVMEFVGGISLQDRLERRGPLDAKEILRIGMQTARGLAAAHAQGIIHRDIKPANILLENGVERVKITDFGLARAADDANLTQSGVITGTPNYMSPEQAAGTAADARSDLFSLGSVLYALCTGHPPFRAETPLAVLRRVADDPVRPPREANPDVPDWLDAIVRKLLAKSPADRFQTAAEVAELLGRHLAHLQQPGAVPMPAPVLPPLEGLPRPHPAPQGRFGCWAPLAGVVGLVLLVAFRDTIWSGVFRSGYFGAACLLLITGVFLVVSWVARRREKPGWQRRQYEAAMVVLAGCIAAALLVGSEDLARARGLSRTVDWLTYGLFLAVLIVHLDNLVRLVPRVLSIGPMGRPDGPPSVRDRVTGGLFKFGAFWLGVCVVLALLYAVTAERDTSRTEALQGLIAGVGLVTLLVFGPGVYLARRHWRKRYGSVRPRDRRPAVLAALGIVATLLLLSWTEALRPVLRDAFGRPADARLAIHWDKAAVDRVIFSRDGTTFQECDAAPGWAHLTLPPGPYTVVALRGGREVYREEVSLVIPYGAGVSIFEAPAPGSEYVSLRVACTDPTVTVNVTAASVAHSFEFPHAEAPVTQPVRLGEEYRLAVWRGPQLLHTETVRLNKGEHREFYIPPVVQPERTVELKPKGGSFPWDVVRMQFSPDRALVAAEQISGPITVFDAATGEERFTVARRKSDSTAFGFTPDSRLLAYIGQTEDRTDPVVRFVSVQTGDHADERLTPKGSRLMNALALAFSPDGNRLAVSAAHNFDPDNQFRSRIHRWQRTADGTGWEGLTAMEWQDGTIEAMRFSPAGGQVRAVSGTTTWIAWPWDTGQPIHRSGLVANIDLIAVGGPVEVVAGLHVDGKTPIVWFGRFVVAGFELRPGEGPGSVRFASLAVSADGTLGAAGSRGSANAPWDQLPAIRVWETQFGKPRAVLLGHTDWPLDLAFGPDGKELMSAGKDGTVRVWRPVQ